MNLERQLYSFFVDFWRLVKKYAKQPATDNEWDNLLEEAETLYCRYNTGTAEGFLYKGCVMAWLNYLNKREIERKGDNTIKEDTDKERDLPTPGKRNKPHT